MRDSGGIVRVFLLGGAGEAGRMTARRLAAHPKVSEVTIAGRDVEKAKLAASETGEKGNAVKADATDKASFPGQLKDYDILVNAAGPDYLIQPCAVRAAIEADVHYCDIAADGPSAEHVLDLGDEAEEAGVTAIIGIGSCPGVSHLMMMHAAAQLDEVREVRFCGTLPIALFLEPLLQSGTETPRCSSLVNAASETIMKWFAGASKVYRDGGWTDVHAFESGVRVTLPSGVPVTAYPANTIEPLTIPKRIKGVRDVSVLICLVPSPTADLMRWICGEMTTSTMNTKKAVLALAEAIRCDSSRWLANPEGVPPEFVFWASAIGTKDDTMGEYTLVQRPEWISTAAPLALAATKILTGEVRKRGVLPPEACFDPMPFMKEVAANVLGGPPPAKLFDESCKSVD